jgi:phosphate/sulfate permease
VVQQIGLAWIITMPVTAALAAVALVIWRLVA